MLAGVAILPSETARGIPPLIVTVAGVARSSGYAVGVESCVLVQGNGEPAVVGAEDVAAVTTMMSASEEVKGTTTFWRVAIGRLLVSLFNGNGVSLELGQCHLSRVLHAEWTNKW